MFQFNWITTPLEGGGREILYQMFAWLVFFLIFFVGVNYVEVFLTSLFTGL